MKYSVIIPCYNAEEFILRPLTSLKDQLYKNIEIIVVNDGSVDKSEEVILDFIKNNPKLDIKYQRIENSGPSKARNTGIDLSTGDYICFLDSDDSYDIHLFEEVEKIITPEDEIIYWGYDVVDENGKLIRHYSDVFKYIGDVSGIEIAKKKYFKEVWLHTCTTLYKASLIKDNNLRYIEGVYLGEDANFIYKALFNAKNVKVLPNNYYYNVYRSNSLMHSNFSDKFLTEFKAIENTLEYIKENNIPDVYDYFYSLYYYTQCTVAKTMIKSLRGSQGFKFAKMARQYIPKIKKRKPLYLNKKQKLEMRIYRFSKVFFFCFVKIYYKTHKK